MADNQKQDNVALTDEQRKAYLAVLGEGYGQDGLEKLAKKNNLDPQKDKEKLDEVLLKAVQGSPEASVFLERMKEEIARGKADPEDIKTLQWLLKANGAEMKTSLHDGKMDGIASLETKAAMESVSAKLKSDPNAPQTLTAEQRQSYLHILGISKVGVDGKPDDAATKKAEEEFAKKNGIDPKDPKYAEKLDAALLKSVQDKNNPEVKKFMEQMQQDIAAGKAKPADIKEMQWLLKANGADMPVSLRKSKGEKMDGIIGPETRAAMALRFEEWGIEPPKAETPKEDIKVKEKGDAKPNSWADPKKDIFGNDKSPSGEGIRQPITFTLKDGTKLSDTVSDTNSGFRRISDQEVSGKIQEVSGKIKQREFGSASPVTILGDDLSGIFNPASAGFMHEPMEVAVKRALDGLGPKSP